MLVEASIVYAAAEEGTILFAREEQRWKEQPLMTTMTMNDDTSSSAHFCCRLRGWRNLLFL